MREMIKLLQETGSFPSMEESDLFHIVRIGSAREFRKDKTVIFQGDRLKTVHIVLEGSIRKVQHLSNQSSMYLARAEQGMWIGLEAALLNVPCSYEAITETAVRLFSINAENFRILPSVPGLEKDLLTALAKDVYSLHALIDLDTPDKKITAHLAELAKAGENTLRITQEELAESVGLARETVNRHLQLLQKQGRVSLSRSRIELIRL